MKLKELLNLHSNQLTFEDIRKKGLLIYEYVRGSTAYNLTKPDETSDIDTGGIYMETAESVLGNFPFPEELESKKNDDTWYSFGKFMRMLLTSNPTVLEALFIPDEFVIYEHPVMTMIKRHRDEFLTKDIYNPFTGYAVSQISKAKGLNKKFMNPVEDGKTVLDFCYTVDSNGYGSYPLRKYLEEHNMDQHKCGLTNMPNMKDVFAMFYRDDGIYRGIAEEKSDSLRFSSIPKGETPVCLVHYNKDSYSNYCRQLREYKEWVEKRNPERYKDNLQANYDRKNMMHCVRLLHMAREILKGEGFNAKRTWDHDFLMNIRKGHYTYEYMIKYAENIKDEIKGLYEKSELPEKIDPNLVHTLLLNARCIMMKSDFQSIVNKMIF